MLALCGSSFLFLGIVWLAAHPLVAALAFVGTIVWWLHDRHQLDDLALRNYPILGRIKADPRALFRQQSFSRGKRPFDDVTVGVIRDRANDKETLVSFGSLGTEENIRILHSWHPTDLSDLSTRILIGSDLCQVPYSASLYNISALSFGAISNPALRAFSRGARDANCYICTGEAGLHPTFLEGGGDLVWQIGTGFFGCRTQTGEFDPKTFRAKATEHVVKMIELKLSQGAKPASGSLLPAEKVTEEVASLCGIPAYQDSRCAANFAHIASHEDLLRFVQQLRELSDGKPIGLKLCVGQTNDIKDLCSAMVRCGIHPDYIQVDCARGGSGSVQFEYLEWVGLPLETAVPTVDTALREVGLRDQIRIIASGKIATSADIVGALSLGADSTAGARPYMIALGCVQALECGNNTCPTGIATQNTLLSSAIAWEHHAKRIHNFHKRTINGLVALASSLGVHQFSEIEPEHVQRVSSAAGRRRDDFVYRSP